jgi:hypothetical protein
MRIDNDDQVQALLTIAHITGLDSRHEVCANFQLSHNGQHVCEGDTINITADTERSWTPEQIQIFKDGIDRLRLGEGYSRTPLPPTKTEPEPESLPEDLFEI